MRRSARSDAWLVRTVQIVAASALVSALGSDAMAQGRNSSAPPPLPEEATETQGWLNEPAPVRRAVVFLDRHFAAGETRSGLYPEFGQMIPGAGWISGGPGYRQWFAEDQVVVDGSAAVSWRGYKVAQARVELPRLARSRLVVGSQWRWQDFTQLSFFGSGPESHEASRSEYRLRSRDLVGYATVRPAPWLGVGAQIGWLRPSVLPRGGLFERDRPETRATFPGDPVFSRADQPAFVHTQASITADTRDFAGHPTRGGLLHAAATSYSDREDGTFSFRRYEAEAAGFVPLAERGVVIALHGRLVASATDEGQFVPFYLQPNLGGHNSLRSYSDFRFHDRNLVLMNAEVRVPMMTHVDLAGFFDAGNVASRFGDLNFDRRSYGAGLRLHSRRQTFARVDLAHGGEGWRLALWITDPFKLTRLARRTAQLPFMP